jgi:hypothetical protein
MLIRLRRTPLSESACALLAGVIQGYETTSIHSPMNHGRIRNGKVVDPTS